MPHSCPTSSAFALAAYTVAVLATVALAASPTPAPAKKQVVGCGTDNACYPWTGSGPACAQKSRINLRFTMNIAAENARTVSGRPDPVTEITYAFCPFVDQLQAFNLSNAVGMASVYPDNATGEYKFAANTSVEEVWISAIGMGNTTSRWFPPRDSRGQAMIIDGVSTVCPTGAVGVVTFLSLNLTLKNGMFPYQAGHDLPVGVGFNPTCDKSDSCKLDASLKCIGETGFKNCGRCVSNPAELANESVQIWNTYYGTDVYGRRLTSGSSNPLAFRSFSGASVFSSILQSYDNFVNGVDVGSLENEFYS